MAPKRQSFPRQCRLTRGADILRVRAEGNRQRTPWFDVRSVASARDHSRIAIVVPRFDKTAVARNSVKRRLRELVRIELLPALSPHDVVVRATPSSYAASFAVLRLAVREVAHALVGGP